MCFAGYHVRLVELQSVQINNLPHFNRTFRNIYIKLCSFGKKEAFKNLQQLEIIERCKCERSF